MMRTSRRTRLLFMAFGALFVFLVMYWYFSDAPTPSYHHVPHWEKHPFDTEFEKAPRDVLPVVSVKDTISDLRRIEKMKEQLKEKERLRLEAQQKLQEQLKKSEHMLISKKEKLPLTISAPQESTSPENKEDEEAVKMFKKQLFFRRQLVRGVPRGGPILLKFDNLSVPAYDISKNYLEWQEELGIPTDVEANSEGVYPSRFRPEVGNGHLATVAFSNRLHINNLFIGFGNQSRRVRLPTLILRNITRIRMNNEELESQSRRFSMNMATGVFTQFISGSGLVIEQRIYAHRKFASLFVHEVDVIRRAKVDGSETGDVNINLDFDPDVNNGDSDINLLLESYPHKSGDFVEHAFGEHFEREFPKLGKKQSTNINMLYTPLPATLKAKLHGGVKRIKWIFLLSVNVKESVALEHFEIGSQLIKLGDWLYLTHLDSWRQLWQSGRVQVTAAGSQLPSNLLSAQYYIYSSLPWIPFKGYTFGGLSPCGLAHGGSKEDHGFFGHVYWDQDLWVFPGVLLLHQRIARESMLQYRLNHLEVAKMNARKAGWRGAKFPWESAVSGMEIAPNRANSLYQHHITGAVSLAAVNYILATNDTSFVKDEGGYQLLLEIAKFWKSRLTRVLAATQNITKAGGTKPKKLVQKYRYEIWDVMGPDEFHERVNNSAYTNSMARFCLESLDRVEQFTRLKFGSVSKDYKFAATKIYIPFSHNPRYHPEFDGYKMGSVIKQADVVLMGYPLHYVFDSERRNDLVVYEKALNNGPGMSWGMHTIGWLELKEEEKASSTFKLQFMHVQSPFKVWSEYSSGGRTNFITAAGGFLQSILNGYFGLRLRTSGLYFDPRLPFGSSEMNITGLDYLGNSLDLSIDDRGVQIRCVGHDGGAPRLQTEVFNASPYPIVLSPGKVVGLPFGRGVVRVMKDGARWPSKAWSQYPLLVEKKIVMAVQSARKTAAERLEKIKAFRLAAERRRKNKKRSARGQKEDLEQLVAKKLKLAEM